MCLGAEVEQEVQDAEVALEAIFGVEDLAVGRERGFGLGMLGGESKAQIVALQGCRGSVVGGMGYLAADFQLLQQEGQHGVVQVYQAVVVLQEQMLQLVAVVEEVGRGVVGRDYCAPMSYLPGFLVADADLGGEGVVALRADHGHGERLQAVAGGNDGPVAESLLGESLVQLDDGLVMLGQGGHVGHRGQVGGGK